MLSFPATVVAFLLFVFSSSTNAVPTAPMSSFKRDLRFGFGQQKVRGVNLGGWFVLEPWITPSIFEATPDNCVDEYTMSATLGRNEMVSRMQTHWATWITAADFPLMASYGINMVRIPIGYWSVAPVADEPYVQGAYAFLAQALDWAQTSGIKVLIDLHGAPGSQNGFDNSGARGGIGWLKGDTVVQTHAALNKIRDDHANHPAVVGIELVNEPMGPALDLDVVKQFYNDGWGDLQNTTVAVTVHDAFEGVEYWNEWGAGMASVIVDTHIYQVFNSEQLSMSPSEHISEACTGSSIAGGNKWTIAGEWTGAQTDCAKWLNGRGVGSRYDGTYNNNGQNSSWIGSCQGKDRGTVKGLSAADRSNIKSFIEAQMVTYEEKADGWVFWTWKTESAPEWHFQDLAAQGLIPQPLGSADPSICG